MAERTYVYIVHWLESPGIYKVGLHTGNRKKLVNRYRPKGDPEVILMHATSNADKIEREFHKIMEDKRIVRQSFDSHGTMAEVYKRPLSELMMTMCELIRRDEAGEFGKQYASGSGQITSINVMAGNKYGATFPPGRFNDTIRIISKDTQDIHDVMNKLRQTIAYIESTDSYIIADDIMREVTPNEIQTMTDHVYVELPEAVASEFCITASKPHGFISSIASLSMAFMGMKISCKVSLRLIIERRRDMLSYKKSVFHVYAPGKMSTPNLEIFNMFPGMPAVAHGLIIQPKTLDSINKWISGNHYVATWLAHALQRPNEPRPPLVIYGPYSGQFVNTLRQIYGRIPLLDIWTDPTVTIDELCIKATNSCKSIVISISDNVSCTIDFRLIENDFGYAIVEPRESIEFIDIDEVYNYFATLELTDITIPAIYRPNKRTAFDEWCIALEAKTATIVKKPGGIVTIEMLFEHYCAFVITTHQDYELALGTKVDFIVRLISLKYNIDINIVTNWTLRQVNAHARRILALA